MGLIHRKLGVVTYSCHPSIWEAESKMQEHRKVKGIFISMVSLRLVIAT